MAMTLAELANYRFPGTQPHKMFQYQGLGDPIKRDAFLPIAWDSLPENSPARSLAEGSPDTHFVNHKPYTIGLEALYNADPTFGIKNMYNQVLGRDPDQAGLDYWLDQRKNGLSYLDFRGQVYNSFEKTRVTPEQRAYVQSQADAGFPDFVKMKPGKNGPTYASDNGAVDRLYAEMLGRLPSQTETAYWAQLFKQNGMNDAWLRREILQSPEYKQYQSTGVAAKTDTSSIWDQYDNDKSQVSFYAGLGGQQVVRPRVVDPVVNATQRNWEAMTGRFGAGSSQAWQASNDYWNARNNGLNGGGAPGRSQSSGMGALVAPDWLKGNEVNQWRGNFGEQGYRLTPQGGNSGASWTNEQNPLNYQQAAGPGMTLGRLTGRRR